MKKFFSLFLLTLYLLFNSGVLYSMHFCGKSLTSSSFSQAPKEACACGKRTKSSDCCKDKQTKLQVDNSQLSAFSVDLPAAKYFILPSILPQLLLRLIAQHASFFSFFMDGHPPRIKVPVYLFLQVFRI